MKLTVCLLAGSLILALLTGCAASAPPQSLSLTVGELIGKPDWTLEEKQDDPYIYSLKAGSDLASSFLTALQKCPVRKGVSTTALARELLVGMRDISILRQEQLRRGDNPLLFTLLDAELDSLPIKVATFSEKSGECVTDVVMWSDNTDNVNPWSFLKAASSDELSALHDSFEVPN